MRRLLARLLTKSVRLFHAVVNRLIGRRARRAQVGADRRVRLLLAPMESRDHTGQLAGGVVLAALGYQLADPLEGMALAVGDFAMLSVQPTGPASTPTVGDPPHPLTRWLPDDGLPAAPAVPEPARAAAGGSGGAGGALTVGTVDDPLDQFWAVPVAPAPAGSGVEPAAGAANPGGTTVPPAPFDAGSDPGARGTGGGLPDAGGVPFARPDLGAAPPRPPAADAPVPVEGATPVPDDAGPAAPAVTRVEAPTAPTVPPPGATATEGAVPVLVAVYLYGAGAQERLFVQGVVTTAAPAGTVLTVEFTGAGRALGSTRVTATGTGSVGFEAVLRAGGADVASVVAAIAGVASAPAPVGAGPDGDLDGVPDWVEARAPGRAADANRAGVSSLPTAVSGAYVTLDAGPYRIRNARAQGRLRGLLRTRSRTGCSASPSRAWPRAPRLR